MNRVMAYRKLRLCDVGPIVRLSPDEVHIEDSAFVDTLLVNAGQVSRG
jgi:hypothetical protein